jgi:Spy/CpxP family protein refolding chaperone
VTKSTRSATLLLIAAFLLGGVAGAALHATIERRPPPREGRGPDRGGYLARLTDDLKLTAEQRDSIRVVLEHYHPRMDSVWESIRPRFETLRGELRSEIRIHLTPDQQRQFDDLLARRDAERRRRDTTHAPR